ncbi:hypothetical protein QQM79_06105 [Marinobacteraceae bacterium S3BR75-40.1]
MRTRLPVDLDDDIYIPSFRVLCWDMALILTGASLWGLLPFGIELEPVYQDGLPVSWGLISPSLLNFLVALGVGLSIYFFFLIVQIIRIRNRCRRH